MCATGCSTTSVGQAIQGVAAVYQRAEFLSERKAAIEAWGAHVAVGRSDGVNATGRRTVSDYLITKSVDTIIATL
jgi:hypothetical protein